MVERISPDLIAEVVRRPAPALGGLSLLEAMIKDPAAAADTLAMAFDWSTTA